MEGRFAVPLHFAAEFLVLVVAVGAALDAMRARRYGARAWALAQAAGFVLLAGAQAIHGSLLAQADGDQVAVAMRAASFVLLAAAARPAASVLPPAALAAGAAPALFFPGPDASFAAIPAVLALVVAARGVRAHRADQDPATFAFAAAFVAFAIAEGAIVLAPADGGAWLAVAHAARALGALFLARWLWASVGRSVRMRTVGAFVLVLTVGVLVVSAVLNVIIGDTLQREDLKRLADAGRARTAGIQTLTDSAVTAAGFLADNDALAAAIAQRRPGAAYLGFARALPANSNFLLVVDPRGKVLGSAENVTAPSRPFRLLATEELSLAGTQIFTEVLGGAPTSASAVPVSFVTRDGDRSEIVVLGAAQVRGAGRAIAGAVAVGYRLDLSYLRGVARDTGLAPQVQVEDGRPQPGGVALLVGRPLRVAATTLDAGGTQAALGAVDERLAGLSGSSVLTRVLPLSGTHYATAFVPVVDPQGQTIGYLMLARRTTALIAAERDVTQTLFLVTLLAVLLAAMLAWLSGGRITRPIRALTAAARELSGGNLQARTRVTSADEVGALGAAFNEMAAELQRTTGDLRALAGTEADLRARMEATLQSMADGLIATDAEGKVATINRAAERMIGRRAERALGRPIGDVLVGRSGGRSLADAAMRTTSAEGVLRSGGDQQLAVALTAAPLLGPGGARAGRVIVIHDVTREHEAERMKSEFLSNVSHELRTPLTPIKGYAEILTRKDFPREKAMGFLEGILQSTERLERIVEILVDFAAMEAGRLKPRQDAIPVRGLLDPIAARWRERAAGHRFVCKGGGDLPPLLGDQRLLSRSLDELIDNAVKFSPDGGRIDIVAEPFANGARGAAKIRITVRDRGIGIEPEKMPDLFQDFRQLDGSATRTFGGLGLGLAYVRRIVNVHGGEVLVESEPGEGSAFSLVLPAAETTKGDKPAKKGTPPRPRKKRR